MENLTEEQKDKIELIESTFQKVEDVIKTNLKDNMKVWAARGELANAKKYLITSIIYNK